jgi:hypothetical protein
LPRPPNAGLQDISPSVSMRWVTRAVRAPMRAAAAAASLPAWPPPMTMTSKSSRFVSVFDGMRIAHGGARESKLRARRMAGPFHVSQDPIPVTVAMMPNCRRVTRESKVRVRNMPVSVSCESAPASDARLAAA